MYVNGERRMAWLARIEEVFPIEGKDRIVQYRIGGWKVIDGIGKYDIGDLVIYISVDSWVPHELAPFLSRGKSARVFEGVNGERLKTMKMGGALSQGLILPLTCLPPDLGLYEGGIPLSSFEDTDVTEALGILKWEKSPEFMAASPRSWPT